MPVDIKIKVPSVDFEMNASAITDIYAPLCQNLFKTAQGLHTVVPLVQIEVKPVDGVPNTYRYDFEAQDGREWKQVLDFTDSQEAAMTFDVPDCWKMSEFRPHRELREAVITAVQSGGMTKLEIKYT